MDTAELLNTLSDIIFRYDSEKSVKVGIDGIDASGKTHIADLLASYMKKITSRNVLRASIDGFHNPRHIRIQKGEDSPVGYFEDSFNYPRLQKELLEPLTYSDDPTCRTRIFDYNKDIPVNEKPKRISTDTILIFDGIFLMRNEIADYWDITIFVKVNFPEALRRAIKRDGKNVDKKEILARKYKQRYFPAQKFYLHTYNPEEKASIVVDNNDFNNPEILVMRISEKRES